MISKLQRTRAINPASHRVAFDIEARDVNGKATIALAASFDAKHTRRVLNGNKPNYRALPLTADEDAQKRQKRVEAAKKGAATRKRNKDAEQAAERDGYRT